MGVGFYSFEETNEAGDRPLSARIGVQVDKALIFDICVTVLVI